MQSGLGKLLLKEEMAKEAGKLEEDMPMLAARSPTSDHGSPYERRYDSSMSSCKYFELLFKKKKKKTCRIDHVIVQGQFQCSFQVSSRHPKAFRGDTKHSEQIRKSFREDQDQKEHTDYIL